MPSRFVSIKRTGWLLRLEFERIGDTRWVSAGALRAAVAELDRLEVTDAVDIPLLLGDADNPTRLELIAGSRDA